MSQCRFRSRMLSKPIAAIPTIKVTADIVSMPLSQQDAFEGHSVKKFRGEYCVSMPLSQQDAFEELTVQVTNDKGEVSMPLSQQDAFEVRSDC